MVKLSAVAVEREIVGSDSEAELICDEGEMRACCWAAARSANVADREPSGFFDFGDVEKKWTILFAFDTD
jgi:Ser/Thr protein kinase RdoA (MazF antagonist)